MVDDDRLVERLRRAHGAQEVPVPDAVAVLHSGWRARRRRAVARWSGAAAACAGAVVLAVGLAGGWDGTPNRSAAPSPEETSPFLPVTVLDAYGGVPGGVADPFGDPDDVEAFRARRPLVDLAAGTVTLWTGGSSSCPTWPKAIRAVGDVIEIVVGLPDDVTDGCTADWGYTTYVVDLPPGYTPEGVPAVRELSQAPGPGGAADLVTEVPPDDAGGCRPALTACAMARWLDDVLSAAGLDATGDAHSGPDLAYGEFVVGTDRVNVTLGRAGRDGRAPIDVTRTTEVGPVRVEHGALIDGVVPTAVLSCGGFRIRLNGAVGMPAEALAQTAETIAGAVAQCPADLDQLLAAYPDLGR